MSMIAVFPFIKVITTIIVYLFITSHIRMHSIRRPLLMALGTHLIGLCLLILCVPFAKVAIAAVFFSAICEAAALAVLGPLCESIMSVAIPSKERARVNSLITAMILLISIPIGAIAGQLSQYNRMLPLVMNICLLIAEMLVVVIVTSRNRSNQSYT